MDTLSRVLDDLGRLLRYFMPALVGVVAAWLLAPGALILPRVVTIRLGDPPSSEQVSWMPLLLFMLAMGVMIYTVHSNISCRPVLWIIHSFILKGQSNGAANTSDWEHRLDLARWDRRYGDKDRPEARVQEALNSMNHGGHFLYCSSYAIVLVPLILDWAFGKDSDPSRNWWVLASIAVIVWTCAFVSDIRTTRWDARALATFGLTEQVTEGAEWRTWPPIRVAIVIACVAAIGGIVVCALT